MKDSVNDPGVNTWDPLKHSIPLFQIFTSLDERRATEWSVDEAGNLTCKIVEDLGGWDDWRQVAKYLKALKAYRRDKNKPFPRREDYVKTSDR